MFCRHIVTELQHLLAVRLMIIVRVQQQTMHVEIDTCLLVKKKTAIAVYTVYALDPVFLQHKN